MYTSGTTSLPKGVMLRFRDFTAYVTANVELADGSDRGVALVCVPFYHIAGTTAMMTHLWTGRKLVIMPQFDARNWLQLVERRARDPCLRRPDDDEAASRRAGLHPDRSLTFTNLAYGGAPMPLPVIRRAIEAFPATVGFVNAYGQTRDHLVADRARS